MNRIEANITSDMNQISGDVEALLKAEFAAVEAWKNKGILEHLYVKKGKAGAVLVFKDIEQTEVEELLGTLPLYPYFQKVDLTLMEKSF